MVLRWISSVPPPIRSPGANRSRSTHGAASSSSVTVAAAPRIFVAASAVMRACSEYSSFDTDPPAGTSPGTATRAEEIEHAFANDSGGNELANDGIVGAPESLHEADELRRRAATGAAADRRPLARQHRPQHAPSVAEVADEPVLGNEDVIEEHLVEVVRTRYLPERPHRDTGIRHVEAEAGEPGLARRRRVAPGDEQREFRDAGS